MYCLHTNTFHDHSLDEAIHAAITAGLPAIEISAVQGWTEHIMPSFSEERIARIIERIQESGLIVTAMSGHCDLRLENRREDFLKNIALASRLGCKTIITSSGEAHFGKENDDDDELIAGIQKALAMCEKMDMVLALETHGNYGSGEKLAELVRRVNHPLLGIAYDTANVIRHGQVMPEEDIRCCAEYVRHVHLKDKSGERMSTNFVPIGSGWIAFDQIFKVLDDAAYTGDYSVEIEYFSEYRPTADEILNDVVKSADWLRKSGRM